MEKPTWPQEGGVMRTGGAVSETRFWQENVLEDEHSPALEGQEIEEQDGIQSLLQGEVEASPQFRLMMNAVK
jgi:hypothetical protein